MGLKEFMKKSAEDKEFAAKYQSLGDLDAMIEQAAKDGYAITKEEVIAYANNAKKGELSDDELESVAGGKNELKIAVSVTTLGIKCAISVAAENASGGTCNYWYTGQ